MAQRICQRAVFKGKESECPCFLVSQYSAKMLTSLDELDLIKAGQKGKFKIDSKILFQELI
jgi:hypothetical protein